MVLPAGDLGGGTASDLLRGRLRNKTASLFVLATDDP
jgi:hypothetical protein